MMSNAGASERSKALELNTPNREDPFCTKIRGLDSMVVDRQRAERG